VIPAPTPAEQGTATSSDGTRIAWWRYGDGERTVLFVPTWNLVDSRVVGHQIAALQDRATVIRFDPRGAGQSDRPAQGYDFPRHAEDALAVMDAAGVGTADVVTASRGLNVAILIAVEDAARVDRIAVFAPAMRLEPDPTPPDPEALERVRQDWPGFIEPFMHAVFTEPGSDALIKEMIAIGLDASPDVVADGELEVDWTRPAKLLGSVTCPTLIVHGEQDKPVPVDVARAIHAALPNARLELIPDGGHRPDIRSPELVNPLLLEFLAL
jgi:pimeloyl-ACP methyl ester carboxylesterase